MQDVEAVAGAREVEAVAGIVGPGTVVDGVVDAALFLLLGALGLLPRVRPSTRGEGTERRYFYGSVWAVVLAQALLLAVWKTLPATRAAACAKLAVFAGTLLLMALAAHRGALPRTRPIVPGESILAD